VNQKQWMIGAVILVILIIVGVVVWRNSSARPSLGSAEDNPRNTANELVYCSSGDIKPCVVSFSLDADDNMLVNFLLPDPSFPNFYLIIVRGDDDISYICRKVPATTSNAYCFGEKLPPGEIMHLMLISTRGNVLLAEGDLAIIGLVFPTLEITTLTGMPTDVPAAPAPTKPFVTVTSTETKSLVPVTSTGTKPLTPVTPTPTPTQPSYPNNTSYP